MKNITYLFLTFFFSLIGYGQTFTEGEGFEDAGLPNLTTDQWDLGTTGLGSNGIWGVFDNGVGLGQSWNLNSSVALPPLVYEGVNSAYMNRENIGIGNTSRDYLATPKVTIPTDGQIRFFTRTTVNGVQGTIYKIMVAPGTANQNDPSAYNLVVQWNEDQLTEVFNVYEEKVVSLSQFAGEDVYVAFVMEFTQPTGALGGDRWLVDNVRIVQECFPPDGLSAGNITQTTANLSWDAGNATQWQISIVSVTAAGPSEQNLITVNGTPTFAASGTTFPLANFTPSTCYKFYVRAICDGNVSSDWSEAGDFCTTTPGVSCGSAITVPPTLPYSDTANTSNFGDLTDVSQAANCAGSGSNYMTGNDVFYSYTPTESGAISITMTPTGSSSSIFVYQGCANVGISCLAGVANNGAGIREIPTLNVVAGQEYIIVISSGNFVQTIGYTLVIQKLNCAAPTGLSALSTGPSTATLSWQNPSGATSWEVFVQTQGSAVPTTSGTTVGTTSFAATNVTNGAALALGTSYQFWVRADCGDGTFSPWVGPKQFNTTSCTSGCNYTFVVSDSLGDSWNGAVMTVVQDGVVQETLTGPTADEGQTPINVSVTLCDGPFQLFWTENGDWPTEVNVSIINSFNQTIYVKPFGGGANTLTPLYSGIVNCGTPDCLPPQMVTVSSPTTYGVTLNWTPNGPLPLQWQIFAAVQGSAVPDASSIPFQTISGTTSLPYIITEGLLADTTYTFFVRAVCASGGVNPWSEPSNEITTLPTCPKPTNLVISNPTMTSLQVDWTAGGTETSWQYNITLASEPAPLVTDTDWVIVSDNTANISGLISGTLYNVYVMAICSPTDSSTVGEPVTGSTTICPPADQCLYTFTLTDLYGDGWNGNTMNVVQNGIVVGVLGETFTSELGVGPVVQQVAICNSIPFQLFWNTGGAFPNEVGITITNPFDQVIYTLTPDANNVQGVNLFFGTGQCTPLTCLEPTNISVISSGLDSVTFSWTENNTPAVTSWDVIIQPSSDLPPLQGATPDYAGVTENPFTATGLDPATIYTIYVRAICSDSNRSYYAHGATFNTAVCLPSQLCDYTFIMTSPFGEWYGNTMSVSQNGILVETLVGPDFQSVNGTETVTLSLCNGVPFELFWENTGFFAEAAAIQIVNQTGEIIYTKEAGVGSPGTLLYSGTVQCIPATCPKPVQLGALDIGETTATLIWTEANVAENWEILILPLGSPAPNSTTVGIPAASPYSATDLQLDSGTAYVFYVRALCSPTDISNWAGPFKFTTLISNDECETATVVLTNPGFECLNFGTGTFTGATASPQENTCFGDATNDVWFQFVATSSAHFINFTGLDFITVTHAVYEGADCGNLNLLYCSDFNSQSVATDLVVGQTYYIRVFPAFESSAQVNFTLCIGTIPPPIVVSQTDYTEVQLIENVLLNSTCAGVSNVTWSTGTNFGSTNGIGYFQRNNSIFPFEEGIVLTTGNASDSEGPNDTVVSDGAFNWPGDPDLVQVLADQGIFGSVNNATTFEFDFVPVINSISFKFIFASEEYGNYQCGFSDVFAFLLTDTSTGVTTNLAVIPSTTTPISVFTVRDAAFNPGCPSVNEEYFDTYYQLPEGVSPFAAPTNYNGSTVPLTAFASVVPGNTYHIKLAIADYSDTALDSAVFIEGGSFGFGSIDLGSNLLQATGNALCAGGSTVLQTDLDPEIYTFTWSQDGVEIPNEVGTEITVTEPGEYTINASFGGTTCVGSDSVIVEYYAPVVPGTPSDLYFCSSSPFGEFNLTNNNIPVLTPLGSGFNTSFFLTQEDADANSNAISATAAYTNLTNPQTIFVRAYNILSGCYAVTTFNLIVQDLTPQFNLPEDFNICLGSSGLISVTPFNFALPEATYSWTLDGVATPDTTSTISVTAPGLYEVTVNVSGCTATLGVTVGVSTGQTVTAPDDVTVCGNYILPALTAGNYFTEQNGLGTPLFANDPINSTQTIYVFSASNGCTSQDSFTVTVNPTPVILPISDVTSCGGYLLPTLAVGNYFSGPNGTGTAYAAGETIPTSMLLYVYAANGACTAEDSFQITIESFTVTAPEDQNVCDSYTLPVPPSGMNYYTAPAGGGTIVASPVTTTQTIYVYGVSGTCTSEDSFVVTVNKTPVVTPVEDVTSCGPYTLPVLAVGNYFTEPDGAGTQLSGALTESQTVYIYAQTGTTPNCTAQDSFVVTINPALTLDPIEDVSVCTGSYTLPVLAQGNYFTQPGGVGPLGSNEVTTSQTVYVYLTSGLCSAEQSFTVTVGNEPQFEFNAECQGSVYVITANPSNNSFDPATATYLWTSADGGTIIGASDEQSVQVSGAVAYTVTISSGGCSFTDSYLPDNTACMIQKGISVNGDGLNDTFDLTGSDVRKLQIFNRYGTAVYARNNYVNEWGGQSDKGEELPDGTYYYIIEYNIGEARTGWIYINRAEN